MKGTPSLFKRLLLGFLLVMLPVWLILLTLFVVEQRKSDYDQEAQWMRVDAEKILVSMRVMPDQTAEIRDVAVALEILQNAYYGETGMPHHYRVQIWRDATVLYGSQDLPVAVPSTGSDLTGATPFPREWVSGIARDARSGLVVRVAQNNGPMWMPTSSSMGFYFLPFLVGFPFLIIPTWLAIRNGLRPLGVIVRQIEERSGTELSALTASPYKELAPLIESVNSLLQRLSQRFQREKEFLADAAHELKTPLAIVQLNSDALLGAGDFERRQVAHAGLLAGLVRATHTVHQLLALARSGADVDSELARPVDLAVLLRDRLVQAMPLALQSDIEIEVQAPESFVMALHRESMAALIDNLVSNAIKYSPPFTIVNVSLHVHGRSAQLCVCDVGPGIPPALRHQVFERFFRVPGQDQTGSGLGLAIVQAAAKRNGVSVTLEAGTDGVGLVVRLNFGASN